MLVAGNLRATLNHQPAQAKTLPQNQLGVSNFHVDVPPLNVQQRLDLKALFQKIGVATQNGGESEAAAQSLVRLLSLAESAGGIAPRPESPDAKAIRDLQMLSGNAQLLTIHEQKDDLGSKQATWKKSTDSITKRWPAWERLLELQTFASGLPEAEGVGKSIAAITEGRTLLADPDPVPDLTKQLTTGLRIALGKLQDDLEAAFKAGIDNLAASQVWGGLKEEQRTNIEGFTSLTPPAKDKIATDDDIVTALRASSLGDRRNLLDAVPQRFARVLEEASLLMEPKAQRIVLPSVTIHDVNELDQWLAGVRHQVIEKLKEGPVIL
jgi:hypothetical protein